MQTLEDLDAFVLTKTTIDKGDPINPKTFTSGGPDHDVWCQDKSKAIELWCYELSNHLKAHPGAIRYGEIPCLVEGVFFSKTATNYLEECRLYMVHATLEIVELEMADAAP